MAIIMLGALRPVTWRTPLTSPSTVVDLRTRGREDIHLVEDSGCYTLGADNIIRPRFAHERKVGGRQWAGEPVHAPIGPWVDGILAPGVYASAVVAARAQHR